jgi:AraC-like DNA-binding protein
MRQDERSHNPIPGLSRMEFLSSMDCEDFFSFFECFGDICFFLKDTEGRLLAANSQLLKRYNLSNEEEIIGKTDFDFVPYSLAEKYKNDDREIAETRKPMLNILELVLTSTGIPCWCITNKFPILSRGGEVIGIVGNIHNVHYGTNNVDSKNFFYRILQYIDSHFSSRISIKQLGEHFHLSTRSVERYFQKHLNISPEQFLIKTRILKSCDYLKRGEYISTIAVECGFYDQSSYTRHFRRHMGITPLQYIKRYIDTDIDLSEKTERL